MENYIDEINYDPSHPWLPMDATLLKPYTPGEFLATVKKILSSIDGIAWESAPLPDWQNQPAASVYFYNTIVPICGLEFDFRKSIVG